MSISSTYLNMDSCTKILNEIKIGKKVRFVLFSFTKDEKGIEVIKEGDDSLGIEDFKNSLPIDDVCYGLFHFNFKYDDGTNRGRTILLSWIPKKSKPKRKMLLAASKQSFRSLISSVIVDISASTIDEISEENFLEESLRSIH